MIDREKICLRCAWHDPIWDCVAPRNELVYQCELYQMDHPEEVEEFNRQMGEWKNE